MGAWGTKIFDDDGAADIKAEYKILLGYGVPPEETYQKIKDYFYKDYEGSDDEDVYWLSIALLQWQYGILMDEVKKKALECIDNEEYLERWKDSGKAVYEKRKAVLEDLKQKLLYVNNPVKKVPKCPKYYRSKTKWKIGDLLAYQILTKPIEWQTDSLYWTAVKRTKKELWEKYILLRVVEVTENPVTCLYPKLDYTSVATVMLYDWVGEEIPSLDIISTLKFRPVVVIRQYGRTEIASGVALEWEGTKAENEACKITVLGNDISFLEKKPQLFQLKEECPLKDIQQFNFTLAETFVELENGKVIWHYGKEEYQELQ